MRDVAAHAGVSVITVSRAFRSPELVSAAARARVAASVEKLGYLPNGVASSLSSNRGNIVAALIPNIRNALHAAMIQGLSEVLNDADLHLIVATVGQSVEKEEAVVNACLAQRPCAMVLYHTRHTAGTQRLLGRSTMPVVEVGDLVSRPIDTVVSYSNRDAGDAVTVRLVEQGRREIAMVVPPGSILAGKRYQGHRAALKRLGLPCGPDRRFECEPGYDHGAWVIGEILERHSAIDAVLFSSLASAVGAWFECERRGWRVPERIAIATFDEPELAGWRVPRLTVVRLPRYEVGRRAGHIIVDCLRGRPTAVHRVELEYEVRSP